MPNYDRTTFWEAIFGISPGIWLDIRDSIFVILLVLGLRFLITRALTGDKTKLSDVRRRWISLARNAATLIILLALIFIWSPQLSSFALSLTAFAVAMVVATKEYILCVIGAVYRAAARPFAMGDWIEVAGLRGEVFDETILTTQLQELGTGVSAFEITGRVLTVPNSVFLTNTVFNDSHRKHFLHHQFSVTVEPNIDPSKVIKGIYEIIAENIKDGDELSERYWRLMQNKLKADLPGRETSVCVQTNSIGKIVFSVKIYCSPRHAVSVEHEVNHYILTEAARLQCELKSK